MTKKHSRGCVALFLFALLFVLLSGCSAQPTDERTIICKNDVYTHYPAIVARALPSHTVRRAENRVFAYLKQGTVAEAFDAQALPALEAGLAKCWYPQYLATVIIAIDREKTDAEIYGWRDLAAAGEAVGFSGTAVNSPLLVAAMASGLASKDAGLEGEAFTLREAAKLLAGLQARKLLKINAFDTPIIICFDYQVAGMIKAGRDIEIVVPEEGTLTYVKGLLSNEELVFEGDIEAALLSAGFRLPGDADYENAPRVTDYSDLNAATQDWTRILRRSVLRTRLYSSADGREHILFAVGFLMINIVWIAALMRRSQQKDMRRTMLVIGTLLAGWVLVRLIKYQIPNESTLERYLWYSFYFFELCLPPAGLRIASLIGTVSGKKRVPKPLRWIYALNLLLIILVFANDLHSLAFQMDLTNPGWSVEYSYGPLYYILTAIALLELTGAVVFMFLKVRHSPRRFGVIFPLAFIVIVFLYGLGYALRIPLFVESDMTLMSGMFALLFLELCMRTGQIPVNINYRGLFQSIGLNLHITDGNGNIMIRQRQASLLRSDADTLLYKKEISGGYAVWQTDITAMNRLKAETEAVNLRLTQANALLERTAQTESQAAQARARLELYTALENGIAEREQRLAETLRNVPEEESRRGAYLGILALQVCFIKRWCDLFWLTLDGEETVAFDTLVIYIDELAEIARQAGIKCVTCCALLGQISIRRAMLFYDFFDTVLERTMAGEHAALVSQLVAEEGHLTMKLMLSCEGMKRELPERLTAEIGAAGGRVETMDLDDSIGIWLSFSEGGAQGA